MKQFSYKCVVTKNGTKMYYKRVNKKWKRISNTVGKNAEKGKRKYMMDIEKRKRFILKAGNNSYCMSVNYMRQTIGDRVWYACRRYDPKSYGTEGKNANVDLSKKYIKIPPNMEFIKIPSWYENKNEEIPDQTFELKYTGKKNDVIALVSSDALAGEDLLGADHCNHESPQKIWELVAVREKCTNFVTGGDEKDWFHISEKDEKDEEIEEFKENLEEFGDKIGINNLVDILLNNKGTELHIYGSVDMKDYIDAFVEALKINTSLTKIYIDNDMDISYWGAIFDVLENKTNLIEIELIGDSIDDEIAIGLGDLIKNNKSLTNFHISSRYISDETVMYIAKALKNNTSLKKIYIKGRKIDDDWTHHRYRDDDAVKKLIEALENNTSLTDLTISGDTLGYDYAAEAIASLLENNTTLIELDISNSGINAEDIKKIAKALENNTTLKFLDIGENRIGNEGLKALAEALKKNTSLESLYMYMIEFEKDYEHDEEEEAKDKDKDTGVIALVEVLLNDNTTLRDIELSDSYMGREGVKAIKKLEEKRGKKVIAYSPWHGIE